MEHVASVNQDKGPQEQGGQGDVNDKAAASYARVLPWLIEGDYESALIHLAWHVDMDDGQHTLIFGLVELLPSEILHRDPVAERRFSIRITKQQDGRTWRRRERLCIERFHLPLEKALAWYDTCRAGRATFPVDGSGDDVELVHNAFVEEPRWPYVVATRDHPFLSASWGTVRAHHLYQTQRPKIIGLIMENHEAAAWLSEQLFFRVLDYAEWWGALHLVAPNPVYRELDFRRETSTTGAECSVLRFVPRAGKTLDGLWVVMTEGGPTGITDHVIDVRELEVTIPHARTIRAMSYKVLCPQRGVLEWTDPWRSFIGSVLVQAMTQALESVEIEVPARGGRPSETYVRTIIAEVERNMGRAVPALSPDLDLLEAEETRRQQRAPDRREQRFHGEQDKATEFVRSLIREARSRVWFIDRYFDSIEFWRYAMSIRRRDIAVTIITSAKWLREPDGTGLTNGQALRDAIDRNQGEGQFTVIVIPGDPPIIHDRFLIVDQTVWLLGSSFHSLGLTASMMVQLAHAQDTIDWLQDLTNRTEFKSLEDWLDDQSIHQPSSSSSTTEPSATSAPQTEAGTPSESENAP